METQTPARELKAPYTQEERHLVLGELEQILASGPFLTSRRYPAFLRFVVKKTLADDITDLKERTIGIEVFNRHLDYDTNSDPVVRTCAGEVRKRLAQHYHAASSSSSLEIDMPLGSYVPRFWQLIPEEAINGTLAPASESITGPDIEHPSSTLQEEQPEQAAEPILIKKERSATKFRSLLLGAALSASLFLIVGIVLFLVGSPQRVTPLTEVWQPLLNNPDPVLISAGRPHVYEENPIEALGTTIGQHILRPEFRTSFPTVSAIANVAGFLQTRRKRFQIHEAYSNTLHDLHGHPVVLVTGNDNKWTVLLLQPLRFHFVQYGQVSYIEDTQNPANHDWSVDFDHSYQEQTADYAIVARFYDATTGGPVVVIAGISSNGTEAAGEFAVSPEALEKLARLAPNGHLDENFEAVLKVEVVGGNTGAATVIATNFWK